MEAPTVEVAIVGPVVRPVQRNVRTPRVVVVRLVWLIGASVLAVYLDNRKNRRAGDRT